MHMYTQIDVVKPNLSELVIMVQACLDQNLITDGRATVAHTLKDIQTHSPLVWVDNVTWTDLRILAVALQGVMRGSGGINHSDHKSADTFYSQ